MELTDKIEAYLNGQMSPEEEAAFEELKASDPEIDQQVVIHRSLLNQLDKYKSRKRLTAQMNQIHSMLQLEQIKNQNLSTYTKVRVLWSKYKANVAIAACVAFIAAYITLLSTGYFSTNAIKSDYNALRRDFSREMSKINKIQRSQSAAIGEIKGSSGHVYNPGTYGGTGFALTSNGLIVTNFHVVKDADSIYIQNNEGESYKVKTVYVHPEYDIAVLKVLDEGFKILKPLPYTFRKTSPDLGDDVFTYGFPKDDAVYTRGYLSSRTGYLGDTTEYQVDISVNPGSSGGPLLDNKGNVIGIVKGKSPRTDGASFAVKSQYVLEALESMPKDSVGAKSFLSNRNALAALPRTEQIKRLRNYIYMIKVY